MRRALQKNLRLVLVFFMVAGMTTQTVSAQTNFYKLHALFIYNFIKNIQWQNVGDKFLIGVYGSDNAVKVLKENLKNKKMGTKNIEVVRVNSPADASECEVIYAPKSSKAKIIDFINGSNPQGKLFVTEDDLTKNGASISFIIQNSKLRFKINKNKIDDAGLKVSNSLLSLGIIVNG